MERQEKEGWEIRCKVAKYAWIGKKRKGQDSKNRGAGEVGFRVKLFLCDVIEVVEDTKYDESIRLRVPRETGAIFFFSGNMYMPLESNNMVKEIQKKFGEIAVDLQEFKREVEVVLMGDFNSRIRKRKSK